MDGTNGDVAVDHYHCYQVVFVIIKDSNISGL
jgi:hypothetical protein